MAGTSEHSNTGVVGVSRGRTTLRIRVTPRARTSSVARGDGHLAVRVRAPAEGGKATEEALRTVAAWLGIPRSRVGLISGAASRGKTLSIDGFEPADLRKWVLERLG